MKYIYVTNVYKIINTYLQYITYVTIFFKYFMNYD